MRLWLLVALISVLLLSACASAAPSSSAQTSTAPTAPTPSRPKLTFITAIPAPPASDPTADYQPPPLKSPPQYTVIKSGLVFGQDQPGTNLPFGSTIYHWRNKITEVVGPDKSLIFISRDSEATQIPTPGGGPRPATSVTQVPNGALIAPDDNNKGVTVIYDGPDKAKVIGTIVTKPEDFPYAPTQVRNTAKQYLAVGTYADGSSSDITSEVTWSSSVSSVATVSPGGLVTAISDGESQITASLNGIVSLAVDLTVDTLVSISASAYGGVGPPMPFDTLAIGSTRRVWATGTYSNGLTLDVSSEVTWASADSGVATIDSSGLITGVSSGNGVVTASLNGITSNSIQFAVVPPPPTGTAGP